MFANTGFLFLLFPSTGSEVPAPHVRFGVLWFPLGMIQAIPSLSDPDPSLCGSVAFLEELGAFHSTPGRRQESSGLQKAVEIKVFSKG